ncbi:MAG TPA: TadE/TadG family type IV pilus assembly protein [Chloroflexota bacterium]|jgi:Flp pilus assembly protein TadG|nr:TadE/TadG family type IV pilus assembly protein [Chloroflexota bacterium]
MIRPRRRDRQRGQALVEFALVLPIFALFVFTVIELGLVFVTYYSETRMARETARWLAINRDATDLQVAQHVQNTMLPGLSNGAPGTASGTSTDVIYPVGARMTVTFTGCGSASAPCSNANRVSGQELYVQMAYDVRDLLFLPTTFRIGSLVTTLPTALPAYKISVMVE